MGALDHIDDFVSKEWQPLVYGGAGKAHYSGKVIRADWQGQNLTVGRLVFRSGLFSLGQVIIMVLSAKTVSDDKLTQLLLDDIYTGKRPLHEYRKITIDNDEARLFRSLSSSSVFDFLKRKRQNEPDDIDTVLKGLIEL